MWSSMEAPMMWRSKHRTATCCDMLRHAATLKSRLSTPPNVGQNSRIKNWGASTRLYMPKFPRLYIPHLTRLYIPIFVDIHIYLSVYPYIHIYLSYICPHPTPPNPTPGSTCMRASVCVPFLVCKCQGTLTSHPTPSPPHPVVLECVSEWCASEWNLVCGLEGFARPENRWF